MRRVSRLDDLSGVYEGVQAQIEYFAPITGFNITAGFKTNNLILEPAGTLATGTVTMPEAKTNGQTFSISSTQIITALTITPNSGQTVRGTITTLAANSFASWVYRAANSTWYRK